MSDGTVRTIEGKIVYLGDVETRGASGYQVRLMVVEEPDKQYPEKAVIEFGGKSVDRLTGVECGDAVRAYFNLSAREWTNKEGKTQWFGSLRGWKIERTGERAARQDAPPAAQPAQPQAPSAPARTEDKPDDLPF